MNNSAQKRTLGQYFTPLPVIEAAYAMLDILSGRKPDEKVRIIDPACGDGAFLRYAIQQGIATKKTAIGIDCDDLNSGKSLNGFCLKNQNGLLPIPEEKGGFDYVVGNPPYGTEHLGNSKTNAERKKLAKVLDDNFAVWLNQVSLASVPVEVLFLERFIQLAGSSNRTGHIAIVIPDGVLANDRLQYVREWFSPLVTINCIVSLPRQTFQLTGTTAKTCLLLMTYGQSKPDHKVFVATADNLDESLTQIVSDARKFWSRRRIGRGSTAVAQSSREFVSRMDPAYWRPDVVKSLTTMRKRFATSRLSDLVDKRTSIVSGDHVRGSRGESKGYDLDSPYEYYETSGFTETGYDSSRIKRCSANAYERLGYTEVDQSDILVSCAGVGGVGRARACFISHIPGRSCTGDVFILRLPSPLAEIVYLLLKSKFGRAQIERLCNGTGTLNINASELMSLEIPLLERAVQEKMAKDLRSVFALHNSAMKVKRRTTAENNNAWLRLMSQAVKTQSRLIAELENILEYS